LSHTRIFAVGFPNEAREGTSVSDLLRDRQAFQPDEARLRKQTNMTSTAFHGLHLTREKYLSSPRRLSVTTYSFFSFLVID
jgi:hypothetical protein